MKKRKTKGNRRRNENYLFSRADAKKNYFLGRVVISRVSCDSIGRDIGSFLLRWFSPWKAAIGLIHHWIIRGVDDDVDRGGSVPIPTWIEKCSDSFKPLTLAKILSGFIVYNVKARDFARFLTLLNAHYFFSFCAIKGKKRRRKRRGTRKKGRSGDSNGHWYPLICRIGGCFM